MSVLNEEQVNLVLEIYTQLNDIGDTPLESIKPESVKKESVKPEAVKKEANTRETKSTGTKESSVKEAGVKEAAAKEAAAEKNTADAESVKKKDKTNHETKDAGRKNLDKFDRSARKAQTKQTERHKHGDKTNNERRNDNKKDVKKKDFKKKGPDNFDVADDNFIVKESSKNVRYVDTRQSVVELDKIEGRERVEELVPENIKLDGNRKKNKKKQAKIKEDHNPAKKAAQGNNEEKQVRKDETPKEIKIEETITVGEFAKKINKSPSEIIMKLMALGVMANINNSIDFDTASLIAEEFSVTVIKEVVLSKEDILFAEEEDKPEDMKPRPPVVVVMGHVDHGKTSLLDAIRDTSVIETEAGGITQHIGAYSVMLNERKITFLDTPGHEAFTTMRARGAQVTDVAILVVAADDGIMPQTIEAINHAKAANVTIVVAINKIDKEGANAERVKQMLVEHDLVPEEWGGDTVCVEVSAKKRINIDGLLEMVLLVADMQELKANPDRAARGAVIEAEIDKGKGPVATVLVQNGTLKVGDIVIAGTAVGRVRAMVNDKGRRVKLAGPSTPVEILGLSEVPSGGDKFYVVDDEKLAREVAENRRREQKETMFNSAVKVSLDNLFTQIDAGNMKELNVIIKADVQGSVEAVKQSLEKLSNDEVRVRAIHGGVGAVNES
ncbi:MAG: translation initiation factor IF-2, partial [Oscillospiraceae bacterium]|nr:translation initiation factor IF-2 [Oscillospiraceae bacterium]